MQAAYDNGWIELRPYEGLYCVSCEAYYTESELIDGTRCPIHGTPVELLSEENYFFKLSEFTDPLLEWYEANPGAVTPEAKRNEAIGLIKAGLRDISISRTSITWGVPVPWDAGPRLLRLVRRPHQLLHGHRVRVRSRTIRPLVAGGAPPHRQGHPAVPLRVLAGAADGGGDRAARPHCACTGSCWSAGRRCPSRRLPGSRPPISRRCSGSTASATTSCGTRPSAPTATSPTRAWSPLQRRPGQQSRQPAGPGGDRGAAKVRGHRPGP